MPPDTVQVIAAVVRRGDRLLLGRRPPGKRHAGLWEFPGGKMLAGESPKGAATRELAEELSLEVSAVGRVLYSARDSGSPFMIDFTEVTASGVPVAREHSEIGWFHPSELAELSLAPADALFAAHLQGSD